MNAPDPTSLLGSTVEQRYKILQLIGEGGMCLVYRAEDQKRNLQVALKVMPAAKAANPELAARFNREAAAGKRIQHTNVTAISDSGTLPDGGLYLVMELLDGELPAEHATVLVAPQIPSLKEERRGALFRQPPIGFLYVAQRPRG
jgi:serine/threonine-protein kinase